MLAVTPQCGGIHSTDNHHHPVLLLSTEVGTTSAVASAPRGEGVVSIKIITAVLYIYREMSFSVIKPGAGINQNW